MPRIDGVNEFEKDWPLPDDYLLELGRMLAVWGSLESMINLAINKLVSDAPLADMHVFIVIAHAPFQQRLDILKTLCEQLAPFAKNLSDYEPVMRKIDLAKRGKNKYTHNGLTMNTEKGFVELSGFSARGRAKELIEPTRLADIKAVTTNIRAAVGALYALAIEIGR